MRPLMDRTRVHTVGRAIALAVSFAALLAANPAQARRVWPVVGASGDASVTVQCPAGEEAVGFSGRTGLWIDQIQLLCAREQPGGTMSDPHPGSDLLGGFGGGPQRTVCDRNSRLYAIGMTYTANRRQVVAIYMDCAAVIGGRASNLTFGGNYGGSRSDANACAQTATCGVNTADVRQFCPQERFVGFTAHVGRDLNALGFICDH